MEDIEEIVFEDGEFQAGIARHVLGHLARCQKTGYTSTGLFYSLYRADRPKGLVTISHGFSEGMYKYREMAYCLTRLGYSVLAYEHRGHARSVRVTEEDTSVHIDSFDTYVEDLRSLTEEIALKEAAGEIPMHLFGHSMGGCIATLFAERMASYYSHIVLSSPMLALRLKTPARLIAQPVASIMCHMGKEEEIFPIFNGKEKFEDSNSTSRERWQYVKDVREGNVLLQMSNPTWSWLRSALEASKEARENAKAIKVPTLIFLAEDDALVDNSAAIELQKRNSLVTLCPMSGTKHEIMSSPKKVLVSYYRTMDSFLQGRQA